MLTKEQKDNWLKMLRSGDFGQARDLLKLTDQKYCCLGLLIRSISGDEAFTKNSYGEWQVDSHVACLPENFKQMLGSDTDTGNLNNLTKKQIGLLDTIAKKYDYKYKLYSAYNLSPDQMTLSLSGLNDTGVPFVVIADIIEALF